MGSIENLKLCRNLMSKEVYIKNFYNQASSNPVGKLEEIIILNIGKYLSFPTPLF